MRISAVWFGMVLCGFAVGGCCFSATSEMTSGSSTVGSGSSTGGATSSSNSGATSSTGTADASSSGAASSTGTTYGGSSSGAASVSGTSSGGSSGLCVGLTDCSGTCTDIQTDPSNCGGCGTLCLAGESCTAGACVVAASCLAILQAAPASQSGSYQIQPPGQSSTQAYCDMAFSGGGWTLVQSTNGGSCTPEDGSTEGVVSLGSCAYMPIASVEALAQGATAVHVRTASLGSAPTTFITSATPYAIQNLQQGNILNAGNLINDTAAEQEAQWTVVGDPGGVSPPGSDLWFNCSVAANPSWPNVYWACDNQNGFHLMGSWSTWNYMYDQSPKTPMEVYLR